MATLTRKQREILKREELFIDVARRVLLDRGYLGTNMDIIADATEYSKGTLYQHFTCKEDMIAAVLLETMEVRHRLFARAATFRGKSRERLTAIGVASQLFEEMHPDHHRIERITKVEWLWDKASENRRSQFMACDNACFGVIVGVIRDAIAQGDLVLPDGMSIEGILFSLCSMAIGAGIMKTSGVASGPLTLDNPNEILDRSFQALLDGYGWQPLTTEWDYQEVIKRVRAEVFADEFKQLGQR